MTSSERNRRHYPIGSLWVPRDDLSFWSDMVDILVYDFQESNNPHEIDIIKVFCIQKLDSGKCITRFIDFDSLDFTSLMRIDG